MNKDEHVQTSRHHRHLLATNVHFIFFFFFNKIYKRKNSERPGVHPAKFLFFSGEKRCTPRKKTNRTVINKKEIQKLRTRYTLLTL